MNALYILCGLAFSGKSTLGKALARRINAVYISLDEIIAARGLPDGGKGLPPEIWQQMHEEACRLLDEHLRQGRDVVIDDTNCFRFLRDNYRQVAARHKAASRVIFLDVPLEEVQRRRRANDELQTRNSVREEVMQGLIDSFEYPTVDEAVLSYDAQELQQDWFEQHFPE